MPWLAATAFLHSIMIQERRGMLKVWNMVLVSLTYGLCIFGTFLTRSGIISSVHAFARSNIGSYFATYLVLIVVVCTALLVLRRRDLQAESRLESFVSRETAFLLNNWILLGILFAVMWGTLFPLISEFFTGDQITVGPRFFNQVNVPIGLVLLFLTGAGPLFAWRRTTPENLRRNFTWPAGLGLGAGVVLALAGIHDFYALISLALCVFVAASIGSEFHRGTRARQRSTGEGYPLALYRLSSKGRRRYGGYLVHVAIILLFVGFTGQAFTTEAEVELQAGESAQINDYRMTYQTLANNADANQQTFAAAVELEQDGRFLATLLPARQFYPAASVDQEQWTTEVAVFAQLREDFYLVLVGWEADGSAKFQVYINPLVNWVWAGGLVFVLGALWSMWPTSRERRPAPQQRPSKPDLSRAYA